jgi:hypothetical protein
VIGAGDMVPVRFTVPGHTDAATVTDIYSEAADCETGEAAWTGVGSPDESFTQLPGPRGRFHFNWKTHSSWAGTCRSLVLVLGDNTEHSAFFRFE